MTRKPFFFLLPGIFLSALLTFLFHEKIHLQQTLDAYQGELKRLREETRRVAADHTLLEREQTLFKEAEVNGFTQMVSKKKISETLKTMRQAHPFVEAQVIHFEEGQTSLETKTRKYRLHLSIKSPLDLFIFDFIRDLEAQPWGFKRTESIYVGREEKIPFDPVTAETHADLCLTLIFYEQSE